jgi:hypothetical protein
MDTEESSVWRPPNSMRSRPLELLANATILWSPLETPSSFALGGGEDEHATIAGDTAANNNEILEIPLIPIAPTKQLRTPLHSHIPTGKPAHFPP